MNSSAIAAFHQRVAIGGVNLALEELTVCSVSQRITFHQCVALYEHLPGNLPAQNYFPPGGEAHCLVVEHLRIFTFIHGFSCVKICSSLVNLEQIEPHRYGTQSLWITATSQSLTVPAT